MRVPIGVPRGGGRFPVENQGTGEGGREGGGRGRDRQRNRQVSAQALSQLPSSKLPFSFSPVVVRVLPILWEQMAGSLVRLDSPSNE